MPKTKHKRSSRSKYPWDDWFSEIRKGDRCNVHLHQDFDCQIHGMAQQIRNAAAVRKIHVSLKLFDDYIEVTIL